LVPKIHSPYLTKQELLGVFVKSFFFTGNSFPEHLHEAVINETHVTEIDSLGVDDPRNIYFEIF
jgi:hypothetical protein